MSFAPKLIRRQTLLAKIETATGTDAVPSAAENAVMLLSGAAPAPEGQVINNERLASTLSPVANVIGQLVSGLQVRTEARGGGISGSAVAPPDYEPLLLASGFIRTDAVFLSLGETTGTFTKGETVTGADSGAGGSAVAQVPGGLLVEAVSGTFDAAETVTGATSSASGTTDADPVSAHQYLPTSDPAAMRSCTLDYNYAGHRHRIIGTRADFSLSLPVGQPGVWSWTCSGRYADPEEQPLPTVTLKDHAPPLAVNMGLKVGDYTPVGVSEIGLSLGNSLIRDLDVNAADGLDSFLIGDRSPSGTIDPKVDSLASWNPFTAWKTSEQARIAGVVGSSPGNRFFFEVPKAQYTALPYGDREGVATYSISFQCNGDSGDDELRFVFF